MDPVWHGLMVSYWELMDRKTIKARQETEGLPDGFRESAYADAYRAAYLDEERTWIAGYKRMMELYAAQKCPDAHQTRTAPSETAMHLEASQYDQGALL